MNFRKGYSNWQPFYLTKIIVDTTTRESRPEWEHESRLKALSDEQPTKTNNNPGLDKSTDWYNLQGLIISQV